MRNPALLKFGLFFFALFVLVGLDQWTKQIAESRLASQRPGFFSHNMVVEVPKEHEGSTLKEFLREELHRNSEDEIYEIANRYTITPHGQRLRGDHIVSAGDSLEILRRELVVIEGFWDFQYTRNPGAAFGILSDADDGFRRPFFFGVSILAVLTILGLLWTIPFQQQIMFWGLTLIGAGAVGNFIDRFRLDYVIDFIVWKYTDEYRWPTFNLADVFICIGVALIFIEMIRDFIGERRENRQAPLKKETSQG